MTLFEHLNELKTAALKSRDRITFTELGTVLGEAKQIATKKENRDPTDEEVISIIKKTLDGIAELLNLEKDDTKRAELIIKRSLLQSFMPTQLSENEVRVIIENSGLKEVKHIMQLFKSKYAGKYDGKQVSAIAKEFIELS